MAQIQCTDISNRQDLEGKTGNTVLLVTCPNQTEFSRCGQVNQLVNAFSLNPNG